MAGYWFQEKPSTEAVPTAKEILEVETELQEEESLIRQALRQPVKLPVIIPLMETTRQKFDSLIYDTQSFTGDSQRLISVIGFLQEALSKRE
jgi:hypothetical protein